MYNNHIDILGESDD